MKKPVKKIMNRIAQTALFSMLLACNGYRDLSGAELNESMLMVDTTCFLKEQSQEKSNKFTYQETMKYLFREGSLREWLSGENSYGNGANDIGNFNSKGQMVGTNYDIAAKTYELYLGKAPSVNDMRNMERSTALYIYEQEFLIKQRLGELNIEPYFMDLLFNSHVISPFYSMKDLRACLKQMGYPVCKSWILCDEEIYIINNMTKGERLQLYTYFYHKRDIYYKSRSKRFPGLLKTMKYFPNPNTLKNNS